MKFNNYVWAIVYLAAFAVASWIVVRVSGMVPL
jgi:hypothetical protein